MRILSRDIAALLLYLMIFMPDLAPLARRYRYIIYNHLLRPAVLSKGVTHFTNRWTLNGCIGLRNACWARMISPRSVRCSVSPGPRGATLCY